MVVKAAKGTAVAAVLAAVLALAYLLGYAAGELDKVDRDPGPGE